jgi:hypothetical protein
MMIDGDGFLHSIHTFHHVTAKILPFRCRPIQDIDFDNYVLFTGTSHTEGVGVNVEESFPYLVSKYFNYDYFNLAISGTGTDVIEHNLLVWSYLFKDRQPKYVFIEWPPEERYAAKYPGYENYLPTGNWSEDQNAVHLLIKGKKVFENRLLMLYNLSRSLFKCPIINLRHTSLVTEDMNNSNMIWIQRLDRGTDGAHPGPKSHKDVSKKIIEYILLR